MIRRVPGILALALATALASAQPRAQTSTTRAPIVVLVSLDGWRADYIETRPVPNLRTLAARGVRAKALIPSFPLLTFPNHYTLVTGLYPDHHGIVGNNIVDPSFPARFAMSADTARNPRWWGGEPIWVTVVRQSQRAATMFWPGSEVEIGGVRPTYWEPYRKERRTGDRVAQALTWLALPEQIRPSFVSLYFEEVDSASHDHGLDTPEMTAAVAHLDVAIGDLVAGIHRLGLDDRVTLVVVSDHGMTALSTEREIYLDDSLDLSTVTVSEWTGVLGISPKNGDVGALYRHLHGRYPHLAIYRREQLPARLHYGANPRVPAIVGIPDEGWAVTSYEREAARELDAATHGFDPDLHALRSVFVAAGPAVRHGLVVEPFENIHVYDFLCALLHLTPAPNDGNPAVTRPFLR